jgi:quercetin dioxygenase-like cupin family protein
MMKRIYAAAIASVVALNALAAQVPAIKWGAAPAVFPKGARFAVMQGDPGKVEAYTVRLSMPSGYVIKPHYHPADEHITVIQGTFLVGMSDTVNAKKTMRMSAGDFATAPANMHHYAITRGRTIVQVTGVGPFTLTYVNPADDPTKKVANK